MPLWQESKIPFSPHPRGAGPITQWRKPSRRKASIKGLTQCAIRSPRGSLRSTQYEFLFAPLRCRDGASKKWKGKNNAGIRVSDGAMLVVLLISQKDYEPWEDRAWLIASSYACPLDTLHTQYEPVTSSESRRPCHWLFTIYPVR